MSRPVRSLFALFLFVHIELPVKAVHQPDIDEDEGDKYVYGALLGEPEAEAETADMDRIQFIDEKYTESVRDGKPDGEKDGEISKVPAPVVFIFLFMRHRAVIRGTGKGAVQEGELP